MLMHHKSEEREALEEGRARVFTLRSPKTIEKMVHALSQGLKGAEGHQVGRPWNCRMAAHDKNAFYRATRQIVLHRTHNTLTPGAA